LASPEFVLGTVQFGLQYGIASEGRPDGRACADILAYAADHGVTTLDTARAYGTSEQVIGEAIASMSGRSAFNIVTKLSPLTALGPDASSTTVKDAVNDSLHASMAALKIDHIPTLLLHRADHRTAWGGSAWSSLKADPRIGRLGVSVQSPSELEDALGVPSVAHIQLPYNLLDHRWEALVPMMEDQKKQRPLTIHVRSALLQGLLLSDDPTLWARANVADPKSVQLWLTEMATRHAQGSRLALAVQFLRAQPWIDGLVMGVDNLAQLKINLNLFAAEPLSDAAVHSIQKTRLMLKEETLNPACWKKPDGVTERRKA
jgi:spore coat polysaccharide biosynthesis protein SpsF